MPVYNGRHELTCQAPESNWNPESKCGRTFEAARSDAKYCSPACRKRANRASPLGQLRSALRSAERSMLHHSAQAGYHRQRATEAGKLVDKLRGELAGQRQLDLAAA